MEMKDGMRRRADRDDVAMVCIEANEAQPDGNDELVAPVDGPVTKSKPQEPSVGLRRVDTHRRTTRVNLTPRQVYDALADSLGCLPVEGPAGLPEDLALCLMVPDDDEPGGSLFARLDIRSSEAEFQVSWSTETVDRSQHAVGEAGEAQKLHARLQEAWRGGGGARLSATELEAGLRLLERLK